jgi:hypothetical protein
MIRWTPIIWLLAALGQAQAQDGITTRASHTVVLPADEARFFVVVTARASIARETVLATVAAAGISAADEVGSRGSCSRDPEF